MNSSGTLVATMIRDSATMESLRQEWHGVRPGFIEKDQSLRFQVGSPELPCGAMVLNIRTILFRRSDALVDFLAEAIARVGTTRRKLKRRLAIARLGRKAHFFWPL